MLVENLRDLFNFLAVVIVTAPNFRKFDFLSDEDQMDLDKAFIELNRGMTYVAKVISDENKLKLLQNLLDESLSAYRNGENIKGAHLLQDFEEIVFPGKS